MRAKTQTIALTAISAALIIVFNTLPLGLPPSINPLPLRVPSTVVSLIVCMINPWAGAFGALIGHFCYDYMYIGIGAVPALFGPWCYVAYGYLMRQKGGITWQKMIIGSLICIAWITFTLTMGFWLLNVLPIEVAFWLIFSSITVTFILSDIVLLPILPRLRQYIKTQTK
jgi:uncharacterized membrane protein